ncbi:glutathione S-transferase family protein [Qipengyuania spongiae]|uniref:Glutathione S-transferase family protein n=1 Tax=Qipengyuania spongiae TaxID=2909673 RepID=A0ABY5SYE0_9SPHN|nr:glutathione S-transferase family protein [Qipengyuania spongiae]UVI39555.1 glutathione S-transferase family protein [Qipengyuania spongiae]
MSRPGALTVSAFKWVPPFAQGQVRDLRVRWMLREVGWDYAVDLIDPQVQQSAEYRQVQPFGQVPALREEGRPTLFESGAIVLDIAQRSERYLGQGADERAVVRSWFFAALNSLEPYLMEIAIADFFMEDKEMAGKYRAFAEPLAAKQIEALANALGSREWLVGDDFTIADLMMASVMKIVGHTDMLDGHPDLVTWRDRCLARPAYCEALAEQCANFAGHGPGDMGFPSDMGQSQGEEWCTSTVSCSPCPKATRRPIGKRPRNSGTSSRISAQPLRLSAGRPT